jgi:hypothetical protein
MFLHTYEHSVLAGFLCHRFYYHQTSIKQHLNEIHLYLFIYVILIVLLLFSIKLVLVLPTSLLTRGHITTLYALRNLWMGPIR